MSVTAIATLLRSQLAFEVLTLVRSVVRKTIAR
jgi:hypothetical protein